MEDSFAQSFFTTKNQKETKNAAPPSDTPSDADSASGDHTMDTADEPSEAIQSKHGGRGQRDLSPENSSTRTSRPARSPVRMNSLERSPRSRREEDDDGEGTTSIYIGQLPWVGEDIHWRIDGKNPSSQIWEHWHHDTVDHRCSIGRFYLRVWTI